MASMFLLSTFHFKQWNITNFLFLKRRVDEDEKRDYGIRESQREIHRDTYQPGEARMLWL